MRKIASPLELQAELQHILAYVQEEKHPSRERVAESLTRLAASLRQAEKLTCDGEKGRKGAVTYIDNKGYVYCTKCGDSLKAGGRKGVRKLRPEEIKKLEEGETVHY
jgi:RNA polymerase-binding transcription factor DksA